MALLLITEFSTLSFSMTKTDERSICPGQLLVVAFLNEPRETMLHTKEIIKIIYFEVIHLEREVYMPLSDQGPTSFHPIAF